MATSSTRPPPKGIPFSEVTPSGEPAVTNAWYDWAMNIRNAIDTIITRVTVVEDDVNDPTSDLQRLLVADVTVFAPQMLPTITAGCDTLLAIEFDAAKPNLVALPFQPDVDTSADFHAMLPFSWAGKTFKIWVYWGHGGSGTAWDVAWEVTSNATFDDETLVRNFLPGVLVTDTGGTAGNLYIARAETVPISSYENEDGSLVSLRVTRRGTYTEDTMDIPAYLLAVRFVLEDAALTQPDTLGLVNLSLLLNANGLNLSTSFIDSSPVGNTITRIASPVISTDQSKFGGSSISVLSTGGLSAPNGTHFDLTTGDFTIGCWVRRNGAAVSEGYLTKGVTTGVYPWQLWYNQATGKFGFRGFDVTSTLVFNLAGTTTVAANTWYFVVGEREGNTFRLYVDGVVEASSTFSGTLITTTISVTVGSLSDGTASAAAYLDDVFIVKGSAEGAYLGLPTREIAPA